MRFHVLLGVTVAVAAACRPAARRVAANAATAEAWYLDPASRCGFVPAPSPAEPIEVVTSYLGRDSAGAFLQANPWLDSVTTCAGHLPGWDAAVVVRDFEVGASAVQPDTVRIPVQYHTLGIWQGDGSFQPAAADTTVLFVLIRTAWGWRIDAPQLPPHVGAAAALRHLRLRAADRRALERSAAVGARPDA